MAVGSVDCICSKCGAKYTIRRKFPNRAAATNWENWTLAHNSDGLCTECWRVEQAELAQAKIADLIEQYHLPEITGVSDKQISYARRLRVGFLMSDTGPGMLKQVAEALSAVNANKEVIAKKAAEQCNGDQQKYIEQAMKTAHCFKAYKVYTTGKASELIDALKTCSFV